MNCCVFCTCRRQKPRHFSLPYTDNCNLLSLVPSKVRNTHRPGAFRIQLERLLIVYWFWPALYYITLTFTLYSSLSSLFFFFFFTSTQSIRPFYWQLLPCFFLYSTPFHHNGTNRQSVIYRTFSLFTRYPFISSSSSSWPLRTRSGTIPPSATSASP